MNYSNTFDHKYFLQCFLHEIPQSTMFSVRMLTAVPCMMSDMESDLATSYLVIPSSLQSSPDIQPLEHLGTCRALS